ncbi:MAG: sensor domain-containing diguanylate cyclase [Deltaproteobacteria bacterium]|nr:sensor domain-containing diguanylate cyclase [Deltaproteobacteria bacterium]
MTTSGDIASLDHSLASVISGLPDPAAIVDARQQIVHYNRPLLALSGLNYPQMKRRIAVGLTVADLVRADAGEDVDYLRRCVDEGKVFRLAEVAATTATGQNVVLWQAFIPIFGADQRVTHAMIIIRDVSPEARMQIRFRELVREAEARAEDLEFLVAQRTTELTRALDEVTRLSKTDPLTGLANRRAFFETAEREIDAARRYGRPFSILMCDVDHFKRVNDRYGHQAGDNLLVTCAHGLRRALRRSDLLARFGGEEFIALLIECSPASASITAERCRQNISEATQIQLDTSSAAISHQLTASFGLASYPDDGDDLHTLIQRADAALYAAKAAGRNRVATYGQLVPSEVTANDQPSTRNGGKP